MCTYFNKVVLPAPVTPRKPTSTWNSFLRAMISSMYVVSEEVTGYCAKDNRAKKDNAATAGNNFCHRKETH